MENDQLIQQLSDWMDKQNSRSFIVNKKEQGDIDTVELQLEQITQKHRLEDVDDYVASDTILLHGAGRILNGADDYALPQSIYEIALMGNCTIQPSADQFQIRTDRAQYTITPAQKQAN